jgi:Winged helix-turn helix
VDSYRPRINPPSDPTTHNTQARAAHEVDVPQTAVSVPDEQPAAARNLQGGNRRPRGRPSGLDAQQRAELVRLLDVGARAQGFATEVWTLRRVGQLIREKFGRPYSESQVWRILVGLGFSSHRPTAAELERDGAVIRRWKPACPSPIATPERENSLS